MIDLFCLRLTVLAYGWFFVGLILTFGRSGIDLWVSWCYNIWYCILYKYMSRICLVSVWTCSILVSRGPKRATFIMLLFGRRPKVRDVRKPRRQNLHMSCIFAWQGVKSDIHSITKVQTIWYMICLAFSFGRRSKLWDVRKPKANKCNISRACAWQKTKRYIHSFFVKTLI